MVKKLSKDQMVKVILVNRVYLPESGMYKLLKADLLKLPYKTLNALCLICACK